MGDDLDSKIRHEVRLVWKDALSEAKGDLDARVTADCHKSPVYGLLVMGAARNVLLSHIRARKKSPLSREEMDKAIEHFDECCNVAEVRKMLEGGKSWKLIT